MAVKNGAAVLIQSSNFMGNTGTTGGAVMVELGSGSIIQVCCMWTARVLA